jgi:hypothetical protein
MYHYLYLSVWKRPILIRPYVFVGKIGGGHQVRLVLGFRFLRIPIQTPTIEREKPVKPTVMTANSPMTGIKGSLTLQSEIKG